ncbi:translocation/assembly module TamB domain-containing protein [Marinigracilibium pacificum]|uniref:Translocation and assembly module TamB C-terminal domain-containing protein n=1 Tax=Marinigracilibium pacificum TaxID=2729599 RepID=A0A848J655_9BACT|nr:translocation/assembly module TamB domain-containing protein [Marinigracilibium pacificum]NMM49859.1 hypothetical protein [Marinigracilibium pacificum]
MLEIKDTVRTFVGKMVGFFLKALAIVIGLFLTISLYLQFPPIQNFLINEVETIASKQLGTYVEVGHLGLTISPGIYLEDILIKDKRDSEMLVLKHFDAGIDIAPLFFKEIQLSNIDISGLKVNIYMVDENQNNLDELFKSDGKQDSVSETSENVEGGSWEFIGVRHVLLEDIDARYEMAGINLNAILDELKVKNVELNLSESNYLVKSFELNGLEFEMNSTLADLPENEEDTSTSILPNIKVKEFNVSDLDFAWNDESLNQFYDLGIDQFHITNANVLLNSNELEASEIELALKDSNLKILPGSNDEEEVENETPVESENKLPFAFGYSILIGKLGIEVPSLVLQMEDPVSDSTHFNPGYIELKEFQLAIEDSLVINDSILQLSVSKLTGKVNNNGVLSSAKLDLRADPINASWKIPELVWGGSSLSSNGIINYSEFFKDSLNLSNIEFKTISEWSLDPADLQFFLADSTFNQLNKNLVNRAKIDGKIKLNGDQSKVIIDTAYVFHADAFVHAGGVFYKEYKSNNQSDIVLEAYIPKSFAMNYLSGIPQVKSMVSDLRVNSRVYSKNKALELEIDAESDYLGLSGKGYYELFKETRDSANFRLVDMHVDLSRYDSLLPKIERSQASIYWKSLKENSIYSGNVKLYDLKYGNCKADSIYAELIPENDNLSYLWLLSANLKECGILLGGGSLKNDYSEVTFDSLKIDDFYLGTFVESLPLVLSGDIKGTVGISAETSWDLNINNIKFNQKDSATIYEYGDWITEGIITDSSHNILFSGEYLDINSTSNSGFEYWNEYISEFKYINDSLPGPHSIKTSIAGRDLSGLIKPFYPAMVDLDTFNISVEVVNDTLTELDAYLPKVVTTSWTIDTLLMDLKTDNNNRVFLDFELSEFRAGDISLANLNLRSDMLSNHDVLIELLLRDQNDSLKYNMELIFSDEGKRKVIKPSENQWLLNYSKFDLDQNGRIIFDTDGTTVKDFSISKGEQELAVNLSEELIDIDFQKFEIDNFLGMVTFRDSLDLVQGKLNGNINGKLNSNNQFLGKGKVKIDELYVAEIEAGLLETDVEFNDQKLNANLNWKDEINNNLEAHAVLNKRNSNLQFDVLFNTEEFNKYNSLLPSEYIQVINLKSQTKISGSAAGEDFNFEGNIKFQNADLILPFSGTDIKIQNEEISFNQDKVDFEEFKIRDKNNNPLVLKGIVEFPAGYGNPVVDLSVKSDGILLLDNTREDFNTLYGTVFTSINLTAKGLASSPKIDGEISILDKTDITFELEGESLELISDEGIVKFSQEDEEGNVIIPEEKKPNVLDSIKGQIGQFSANIKLKIDPKAKTSLVIDPNSGDNLTINGNGDLALKVTTDEINLSGVYVVKGGQYNLNYYGLVKKQFEFKEGSRVIWKGDPYEGEIKFEAFNTIKTRSNNLFSAGTTNVLGSGLDELNERIPYQVGILITGIVSEPEIKFTLSLPPELKGNYPNIEQKLAQLDTEDYEQERNKQVFALLVTGGFISETPSQGGSNFATSAARNSVNGILTQQLNNFGNKIAKGVEVNFDVSSYDNPTSGNTTTEVDFSVSKKLLNDRLEVQVGSSVGVEEGNDRSKSTVGAAEFVVSYQLTKEGNLKIKAFRENQFDMVDGEITNTGISLIFVKDFEEFNQLFKSKKKEEEKKGEESQDKNGNNQEAVIEEENND